MPIIDNKFYPLHNFEEDAKQPTENPDRIITAKKVQEQFLDVGSITDDMLALDGSRSMQGDLDMNYFKIVNGMVEASKLPIVNYIVDADLEGHDCKFKAIPECVNNIFVERTQDFSGTHTISAKIDNKDNQLESGNYIFRFFFSEKMMRAYFHFDDMEVAPQIIISIYYNGIVIFEKCLYTLNATYGSDKWNDLPLHAGASGCSIVYVKNKRYVLFEHVFRNVGGLNGQI